jgi:hypothetical protein
MNNTQLQFELEKLANPDLALFAQRFFRTGPGEYGHGDSFRGIRVPEIRKLVSVFAILPLSETRNLLRFEFHEDRLLALLILVRQFAKGDELVKTRIYELYFKNMEAVNNWDLVDSSAPYIVALIYSTEIANHFTSSHVPLTCGREGLPLLRRRIS